MNISKLTQPARDTSTKKAQKSALNKFFSSDLSRSFDDKHLEATTREWIHSARQRELLCSASSLDGHFNKPLEGSISRGSWPSAVKQEGTCNSASATLASYKPSSASQTGESLVEAVRLGRVRQVKILLTGGSDPNLANDEGVTGLIAATVDVQDDKLRRELMQLLLESGADPNKGDSWGTSPLMHSAAGNIYNAAITLLQCECTDPGLQDNKGWSALMYAASKGFVNIVLLILASFKTVHHVTYLNQRNKEGLRAADLATQNGFSEVTSLLLVEEESRTRPKGQGPFAPASHDLSRSPTPTDSLVLLSEESEEDFPSSLEELRAPAGSPADYRRRSSVPSPTGFLINRLIEPLQSEVSASSSLGSGNEADVESLMDGDSSPVEGDKSFSPKTMPCTVFGKPVSHNASVGLKSIKIFNSCGSLAVDRDLVNRLQNTVINMEEEGEQTVGQGISSKLYAHKKASTVGCISPLSIHSSKMYYNQDIMPKLAKKSLNKTIKTLAQEDADIKPGQRPPTPAKSSLPTLRPHRHESSAEFSSGSLSDDGRSRRSTLASFPRSTSDPQDLFIPTSVLLRENIDLTHDALDSSTKSEGWEALKTGKGGLSSDKVTEMGKTVVHLPPITGHGWKPVNSLSKGGNKKDDSVLKVAKKTLEKLETVLGPQEGAHSKRSHHGLHRTRTHSHLNMST